VLEQNSLHIFVNSEQGRRRAEGISPCLFKRGATGAVVPFLNSITANFMVYQERSETN